jgi:hypothetical protein
VGDTLNDEDRLLIDQLTSEYRIIQDKIDKIGSFRFTVRGWSVTLVIASIFATSSSAAVSPWLLLLLIIFVSLFYVLEREQDNFGYLFGGRALQIEKEVRRIIRSNSVDGKMRYDISQTPQIAHHLKQAAEKSAPSGRFLGFKRWVKKSNQLFYAGQIFVIIVTVGILLFVHSRHFERQAPSQVSVVVHENSVPTATDTYKVKKLENPGIKNAHKKNPCKTR